MNNRDIKIVVIGGGHAGVEAALAISRMGKRCYMITMDTDSIGRMSCNPAIGGLAKGHLVREIDALGGIMGEAADLTSIQFKTLNKSKGRAVWSPRAQVDKIKYSQFVRNAVVHDLNISIINDEVVDILVDNLSVVGCRLRSGNLLKINSVIITAGTFLNGKIHIGDTSYPAGRFAEPPSLGITNSLRAAGFVSYRLKTGTPPRLLSSSVDWSALDLSLGDEDVNFFSIRTNPNYKVKNIPCYLAHTNKNTHNVLSSNLSKSPMYSGKIDATGPRYCPSVEDKVVKFAGRPSHQLFLEPEWENSKQIYLNGFSTSMPEEVQIKALRTIRGLERCELVRPGYAIEYDYFPTYQLKSTLESKNVRGLFLAGQMNGTSGYEEAAAQGIIAGINSVLSMFYNEIFVLGRNQGYIGVLIDDLITKDINEPYRMFTSRAEHRLYLRQDNADLRLSSLAMKHGLLTKRHSKIYADFLSEYNETKKYLQKTKIKTKKKTETLWAYLKRTESDIFKIPTMVSAKRSVLFTLESETKYEGYISIQSKRVENIKKLENVKISSTFDFSKIPNLSLESVEKLMKIKPESLAQALRIDGVRQSDISMLSFYLYKK